MQWILEYYWPNQPAEQLVEERRLSQGCVHPSVAVAAALEVLIVADCVEASVELEDVVVIAIHDEEAAVSAVVSGTVSTNVELANTITTSAEFC